MSIGILNDEASDPVRRARGEMKPDRSAKVVEVEVERSGAKPREKPVDQVREAGERWPLKRPGGSEPRKVGSDHEAVPREGANHPPEVSRGVWQTVDQEKRRLLPIARQVDRYFGAFNLKRHQFRSSHCRSSR